MNKLRNRPYCCTGEEWKDANYGIMMDGIPFSVCVNDKHMERMYDVLKKRHPGAKWTMVVKTRGVY